MSKRLPLLIAQKAGLVEQAKAILGGAEARAGVGGDALLSEDENTRVLALEEQIEKVTGQIEQARRQAAWETSPATSAAPVISHVHDRGEDKPWGHDTGAPFGEFLQAVRNTTLGINRDPRLFAAAQGMGEAIASDGGFLVNKDMANDLMVAMKTGAIFSRVRRIPISDNANGIAINVIDETSRATGSRFGGVQGYYVDEGTAPTASKPKMARLEFRLKKIAALGYATEELLQDAGALASVMTQAFAEELRFLAEDSFINGTGAGQAVGVLNANALVSVSKETGQAAATVVAANVNKMWARMPAANRSRAVWLANQDVEPALEELVLPIGTGGVALYLPPGGITEAPLARLKGAPVIPVEYCATLGTVGDLILVDLSQYGYIEKGGVRQASSIHVAFTTDETAFRATYRYDGQLLQRSALTPFKGSNTLSPVVALATRA